MTPIASPKLELKDGGGVWSVSDSSADDKTARRGSRSRGGSFAEDDSPSRKFKYPCTSNHRTEHEGEVKVPNGASQNESLRGTSPSRRLDLSNIEDVDGTEGLVEEIPSRSNDSNSPKEMQLQLDK